MQDNKHGIVMFTILIVIIIITRILHNFLNTAARIISYGIIAAVGLMYFQWLYKNTRHRNKEMSEMGLKETDEFGFNSVLVPLLYILGLSFIALSIHYYFRYGKSGVSIVLMVFGLVYIPMAFLISRHARRKTMLKLAEQRLRELEQERNDIVSEEKRKLENLLRVEDQTLEQERKKLKKLENYAEEAKAKEEDKLEKLKEKEDDKIEKAKRKVSMLKK
ncbi:hypothetical protein GF323_04750 [Candidatus Woesearchaeota archaeon]|nr:hypothetical protein [Candidatus Woesearchaeota archaeon]